MSATRQHAALSARSLRALIGLGVALLIGAAVAVVLVVANATEANRIKEARVVEAFRREAASVDAEYQSRIDPGRVVRPISAEGLARGFDRAAVTLEVRNYQGDNARFQSVVRGRPDALRKALAEAGLSRSRQQKAVEALGAERNPNLATRAFLLRHELGEEVLIIADLLDRRRGAWRVVGDELVFATNADRQLYQRALQRQQEIRSAIPAVAD